MREKRRWKNPGMKTQQSFPLGRAEAITTPEKEEADNELQEAGTLATSPETPG